MQTEINLSPDVIVQMNSKELKLLEYELYFDNSPQARLIKAKIRLIRKLNLLEYQNSIKNKRKNSRFS